MHALVQADYSFIWLRDLPLIKAMGANIIRTYGWQTSNDHTAFLDAANANGSTRAHQAKLWNEEELEHVMEDVAVSARGEHFFFFFFRVRGAHFRFFFLAPPETVARR